MNTLVVNKALTAFNDGEFGMAKSLYLELTKLIGKDIFKANISICDRKLKSGLGYSSSQVQLQKLKVACVMDEFSYTNFQAECHFFQLSPQAWQSELAEFKPDFLFIESAWRGKDDQWSSKIGHTSTELLGIVAWCNEQGIPTVFWNKEDPVHFETFLNTAKLFDHVFTTDIDCIQRYKAALNHDRVGLLLFACQPNISNPLETYTRKDAFCFAGAYYVRYPERTQDLENFISALSGFKPLDIYDRNFGKNDPNYQFPKAYQPFIMGSLPFSEIDKAYKGYHYAINLNSIKQSQTMFARRVFELLASNTITVSNYSRGVRLLFGDLVVSTDSGTEVVRRLERLATDDTQFRQFKLAGLRKVMSEHTSQDRLAQVAAAALGRSFQGLLPAVVVTTYAKNQTHFNALLASYQRQNHEHKRMVVLVPAGFKPELNGDDRVEVLSAKDMESTSLLSLTKGQELVAGMVPDDYYGPNYLLDLVLATRYSKAAVIGKFTHHVWSETNGLSLAYPGCQYIQVRKLQARHALVRPVLLPDIDLREWVISLYTRYLEVEGSLSIDEFNYCKNGVGVGFDETHCSRVNDLPQLFAGLSMTHLLRKAQQILPDPLSIGSLPAVSGQHLADMFANSKTSDLLAFTVSKDGLSVISQLADGQHEYVYASHDVTPSDLGSNPTLSFHVQATPGLNLQWVMHFLDAKKQRISHAIKTVNRNHKADLPEGTQWLRMGVRVLGQGNAHVQSLLLAHPNLEPEQVLGKAKHLLVTNHYPSYDDLYRNGFVHTRVSAYQKHGLQVDVFRLRQGQGLSFHEFEGVDAITGSAAALQKLLAQRQYQSVLVHFLSKDMWDVLKHHVAHTKVVVWVHGAEIQPWHRRDFNNNTEEQRNLAKAKSEVRMRFWRELLKSIPDKLELVFVSNYFAEEVMEDLGFRLPKSKYHIIHNPIDTELFNYIPKPPEQRKKILSIRPYASKKYANDLSVKAILELSKEPFFKELEFRMVGDGVLFEETLKPLEKFKNVLIEKKFLTQQEIATLHKGYGIFLTPTRMDAQGVSRDEAMASGLVPITNKVAAIPEFVDEMSGGVVPHEDSVAMGEFIERMYNNAADFKKMSEAASQRVKKQTSLIKIINDEIKLICK